MRGLGLQSITGGEWDQTARPGPWNQFRGAVLPRGRRATQGQDGSPPIALARRPGPDAPFLRGLVTKPRKASGLDPNNLLRSYN
jgi:hypothetical protein